MAINVEPVLGTFIGWCLNFQEPPTIWVYIGGVIILGAIMLSAYETSRSQGKQSDKD